MHLYGNCVDEAAIVTECGVTLYRVVQKSKPLIFVITSDIDLFQNSFTGTFSSKFATRWSLKITSYLKYVASLLCEILVLAFE